MRNPKPLETDQRERFQEQLITAWLGDKAEPEVVQIVGDILFLLQMFMMKKVVQSSLAYQ